LEARNATARLHCDETSAKQRDITIEAMEVVLLRWPAEALRREQLRADAVPRLLLVDADAVVPMPPDDYEDWIRVPADAVDLHVRVETLQRRALALLADRALPVLDDNEVLWVGAAWVSLPPVEAGFTRALLNRYGNVVGRDALARAGWPHGKVPGRNVLDVHVLRLRRRVAPLGLTIRTVRSRGYLLEFSGSGIAPSRPTITSTGLLAAHDPPEAPQLQHGNDDQATEKDL
jgi:DNA-binding winged helix-turn-helix (wHTH) protein